MKKEFIYWYKQDFRQLKESLWGGSHVRLHLCHFYKLKMKFKSDSLS